MQINTGLAVVIVAVLIFYLRLIVIQREHARRLSQASASLAKPGKGKGRPNSVQPSYGILSPNRRDRIIGFTGAAAVLAGVLLNAGLIAWPTVQPYWWIPTAIGIVAFSWAFRF